MARPEPKAKDLKAFDEELKALHMTGQWAYEDMLVRAVGGPKPRGDPYIWPWEMGCQKLLEACEALRAGETARRRPPQPRRPPLHLAGGDGLPKAAGGVQGVPRERARAPQPAVRKPRPHQSR